MLRAIRTWMSNSRLSLSTTIVSSKWTWRSDRGTEGAQILFLKRYRPDVPYVLVTNEFMRAAVVAQESVEDAAFFMCPRWIGANVAVQTAVTSGADPVTEFPRLTDLADRMCDGTASPLMHALVQQGQRLSPDDIAQLRRLLDDLERENATKLKPQE